MNQLDSLLDRFYRAQMPERFPPAPAGSVRPAGENVSTAPIAAPDRSRWALAAGVSLVVGTLWTLSPSSPLAPQRHPAPGVGFEGSSAKVTPELMPAPAAPKPK